MRRQNRRCMHRHDLHVMSPGVNTPSTAPQALRVVRLTVGQRTTPDRPTREKPRAVFGLANVLWELVLLCIVVLVVSLLTYGFTHGL